MIRSSLLRASQTLIDVVVLSLAFALALLVRFDWAPPTDMIGRLVLTLPYVVVGEYAVLMALGVHRFSWRYVGIPEISRIAVATLAFTILLAVGRLALGYLQEPYPYLRHGVIPFGALAANGTFAFLGIAGVRALRRMFGERSDRRKVRPAVDSVPTLLIGAGQAGVLVAKELAARKDLPFSPVGFLDDDLTKVGTVIHGIPVLGTTERMSEAIARTKARQVLLTMASASGRDIRRILQTAKRYGLPAHIVPGLYELVGGKKTISNIRPIAIEDLLGRDPVSLDLEAITADVRNQVILVTGAGGSIGSELCRQLASFQPSRLLLVERAENALFNIHRELVAAFPGLEVLPLLIDVADERPLRAAFEHHRPCAVFHAAAHKHVPLMEQNPSEAIRNNVGGTRAVAHAARDFGSRTVVLISSDKAVNPSSVMGATKRAAELLLRSMAASSTRFVTVRFGNVLGSAGSVVPIFREQIAMGGPITVTHPDMTRYFMTIPEACQLVLQAATMGQGGEVFILDMGEPVRIVDLARDLITLSGLTPDEDIRITFTGIRPGEKLHEQLSLDAESASKTRHEKIFVGSVEQEDAESIRRKLADLERAADSNDPRVALNALHACVREYLPPEARAKDQVDRARSERDSSASSQSALEITLPAE